MKLMCFDQFEFESWEAEEFFVVASELKTVRGSEVKDLVSFFNRTGTYKQFEFWQLGPLNVSDRSNMSELGNHQSIIKYCRDLCGIVIQYEQEICIYHNDWNLQDLLWEDELCFYRVLWCTAS